MAEGGFGELYELRPGKPGDASYFHHSWVNSFKEYPLRARLGRDVVSDLSRVVVLPACDHPERFTVVCSKTEPAFILAWAYVWNETLGYVCVRERYQRMGLATELVAASRVRFYALPVDQRMLSLTKGLEFRPLGVL